MPNMEPIKLQMDDMDSLQSFVNEPLNARTKSFARIEKRCAVVTAMLKRRTWLSSSGLLQTLMPVDSLITTSKREWEWLALTSRKIVRNIEEFM